MRGNKMNIEKENVLKAHEEGCREVKSVLENLFPELFEETYEAGDYFKHNGDYYILSLFDINTIGLISVYGGRRLDELVYVNDVTRITKEEFKKITAGNAFKKVNLEIREVGNEGD